MRKLMLLGLFGFLQAGCSEEKITKDFLNGEWICNQKVFKKSDLEANYEEPIKTERQKRIFKFDGDDLYSYSSKTGEKEYLIKIDAINDDSPQVENTEDEKITTISKFKKDNSEQWTWIHEVIHFSKTLDLSDSKEKYETVCTRIK
ncbi:hypothetical protein [Orbus mooreae]|uniref:hypothetical protein n=1 Tax=Orbus mooreae TaxID=3074107 RepID=UPI00370DD15C